MHVRVPFKFWASVQVSSMASSEYEVAPLRIPACLIPRVKGLFIISDYD